jgi:hypothetical protein
MNFVPWPTHLGYGNTELDKYGQEARLEEGPAPVLGTAVLASLKPDKRGYFPRDTLARRWAYARGATEMRKQKIEARVALAGKLSGYGGLLPGVIEEILLARTLDRKIPIYLIGAFGGATRLAIDLIESRKRDEATNDWVSKNVAGHKELAAEYARRNDTFETPKNVMKKLRELGKAGPAKALDNGLTDDENRELFVSTDVRRLVELILTGSGSRFGRSPPDLKARLKKRRGPKRR